MAYELYWISGSPNAWRAMLTLEIKRQSYVSHRLDPGKREHKAADFVVLNPRGKVPVLVDGDFVLSESLAIMEYLERRHPEPALFGTTAEDTGLIWQRILEVVNFVRDPIEDGVVRPLIRGQAESGGEAIKAAAGAARDAMAWTEGVLSGGYLAGSAISAADIAHMPMVQGLRRAGAKPDAVALGLGFDDFETRYPNIAAWLARLEALPEYDRAYPPHWRD